MQVSPLAAAELAAAATTAQPFSAHLWAQRKQIVEWGQQHQALEAASVAGPGSQQPAALAQEAERRGLALPAPVQQPQQQQAPPWMLAPSS